MNDVIPHASTCITFLSLLQVLYSLYMQFAHILQRCKDGPEYCCSQSRKVMAARTTLSMLVPHDTWVTAGPSQSHECHQPQATSPALLPILCPLPQPR